MKVALYNLIESNAGSTTMYTPNRCCINADNSNNFFQKFCSYVYPCSLMTPYGDMDPSQHWVR